MQMLSLLLNQHQRNGVLVVVKSIKNNIEEKISSASVTMTIVQLQSKTEYWLMPMFVHLKSYKSLPGIMVQKTNCFLRYCSTVYVAPCHLSSSSTVPQPFALQTAFP